MSPQDLESACQPALTLTQGFLYFPQVCFSENEDEWSCFLMFFHTNLQDQKLFLSLLDQLYHAPNSVENTRFSPSEQPCQGQPGRGLYRGAGAAWILESLEPSTHKHHSTFWRSFLPVNLSLVLKEKKTKQDSMSPKAPSKSTWVIILSDVSSLTLDLDQMILQ